jgi:hypothetical protein
MYARGRHACDLLRVCGKKNGLEGEYNKKKKGTGGQLYLSIKKTSCEKDNINTKMACF